ncbi:hypothetical protein [Candidatus Palauibacter sp.]|uniref:hypothetical protein n=1 Tax=Candidatus Palauibacter sp. TaxID=3101350 RepID=UPI003B01979A
MSNLRVGAYEERDCLSLTITRREGSAMPYSFNVMDVRFHDSRDPAAAADTLIVNVVLPAANP